MASKICLVTEILIYNKIFKFKGPKEIQNGLPEGKLLTSGTVPQNRLNTNKKS